MQSPWAEPRTPVERLRSWNVHAATTVAVVRAPLKVIDVTFACADSSTNLSRLSTMSDISSDLPFAQVSLKSTRHAPGETLELPNLSTRNDTDVRVSSATESCARTG